MTGSIVKRRRANGTIGYSAVYRTPTGQQKWKTFDRQKDAAKFLARVVQRVHDRTYADIRPVPLSELFSRWEKEWLDVHVKLGKPRQSTAASYRSLLHAHLQPAFGEVRSDQVSRQQVGAWIAALAERVSEGDLAPRSLNNAMNLLSSILKWGRLEHLLGHDPLVGHARLPKSRVEREFLEPTEIDRLLETAAAHPPDDTILRVAIYTGVRRGELFALRWSDIDWGTGEGGRLFIRRSIYRGVVTEPKTAAGIRRVDISQGVLDDLAVYRMMCPPLEGDLIFRTAAGKSLDPDFWTKGRFYPLLEAAGLRRMTPHSMRHTYASLLINQGESIKYVSRQLGHASINITGDLYGHLFKETSVAAMKKLDAGVAARQKEKAPS